MMNKRGSLVLRDMVFMMMIMSTIFVLAGLFVGDMSNSYQNTNMTNEWALTGTTSLSNSTFYSVGDDAKETGQEMATNSTGIAALISSGANLLKGIGGALFMVLTAPNTIGNLVGATLIDMQINSFVAGTIEFLIVAILWSVIIFTVSAAFLRGGRL